jgi:hypothetical protein
MPDADQGLQADPRLDPNSPEYDAEFAANQPGNGVADDTAALQDAAARVEGGEDAELGGKTGHSVLTRLRRAYAAGDSERTTTIAIAPGRYQDLAAKYRPLDTDLRRKLQRRAERTGAFGQEANLEFQATLLADACLSIMIRPEPGAEWEEAHKVAEVAPLTQGEVVRFDRHLAAILGIELVGEETQAQVARLVFGDEAGFDVHYTQFSTWSTQLAPGEDDEDEDDEGEGSNRPT